ncbi:adenylate/guanylate cyclase domain-containing protein [Oceanibacterium hippocampi]|uniref:Adenylate and Guanylate cyclase catalytic domain protein n=1 Tax=Oceanibacterium hippocampi TaxID=745714 RepID=A0A1Y5U2J3_9PROT|nr:adenylate/guanylate cyclase domain-containing protein [Oceanibacterium hippocampi]SLN75259.1 Adenylate and Guanylate cyclase catalytic domain protein [Oceanibacterium hippocampi]
MAEQRKLAAILVADVVGFSRLAGADEDRTLARLRALRSDLIDPTMSVHNGRIVKRTGDGVLVEFRSVVDAVRCAIELQNSMQDRNAGVPPDRRIEFRIGVHLGDVVEEGDGDLMGDGVNIAARLEGIATPGAICLSEDAYRQVKTRLDLSVRDLGPVRLKNIADAINVYSLQVATSVPSEARTEPVAAAAGTSGKSAIAVLPFANMTGDPEQDYFIDGMVEDIITALARFPDVAVVARNSTFVYKGQAVDIRKVATVLGVRYVLEGSARKSGNRIRITGQLIEATSGTHLWADRYDGDLDDAFDLQDRIVASIVGAVQPTLLNAEIKRVQQKPDGSLNAHDLYLLAQPHALSLHPDENLKAISYLDRAIELQPDYAPALAFAAWCRVQRVRRPTWVPAGPDDIGAATALARRALSAGPDDAVSMAVAGFSLVTLKVDYTTGLDAVRHAVDLNPASSFVVFMAGSAMIWCEDFERGLPLLKQSVAFGPKEPGYYLCLNLIAAAELLRGRPEEALEAAQRAATLNPGSESSYWVLAAALAQVGRLPDARAALAKFLEVAPGATAAGLREALPIRSPDSLEKVIDSLREAGLPD